MGIRNNTKSEKHLGVRIEFGKTSSSFEKNYQSAKKVVESRKKGLLIKSVLQAIPNYNMSFFKILKRVFDDIDRITTKFWWGSKVGMQQLYWESLSKLYDGDFYVDMDSRN